MSPFLNPSGLSWLSSPPPHQDKEREFVQNSDFYEKIKCLGLQIIWQIKWKVKLAPQNDP